MPTTGRSCGITKTRVRFARVSSTTAKRTTWPPAMTSCMSRSTTPVSHSMLQPARSWRLQNARVARRCRSEPGPIWRMTTASCSEPARFAKNWKRGMRRRGLTVKSQTDAIFAVDTKTGERIVDLSRQQHSAHHDRDWPGACLLHRQLDHSRRTPAVVPEGQRRSEKVDRRSRQEGRSGDEETTTCGWRSRLDRRTGKKLWEKPVNVTDTTERQRRRWQPDT